MIKLNNDYKNIYNKIKNLEEHFLDCKKPLDSEAYVKMYETLLMIYIWDWIKNIVQIQNYIKINLFIFHQ